MRTAAPEADFAIEAQRSSLLEMRLRLAAAVERMHPLWFDEPCPVSNLETIRKISEETVVPLGFGRTISDPGTFQDLLREGLVDLLRPDLLTHGITGIRRLAAMAETYYVDVAPWHHGGPIATAAALHAAASMPNFFIAQSPMRRCRSHAAGRILRIAEGPGTRHHGRRENVRKESDRMNRRKFLGAAAMMAAAVPGSRMGAAVGGPRPADSVRMRSISWPGAGTHRTRSIPTVKPWPVMHFAMSAPASKSPT